MSRFDDGTKAGKKETKRWVSLRVDARRKGGVEQREKEGPCVTRAERSRIPQSFGPRPTLRDSLFMGRTPRDAPAKHPGIDSGGNACADRIHHLCICARISVLTVTEFGDSGEHRRLNVYTVYICFDTQNFEDIQILFGTCKFYYSRRG